MNTPIVSEEGPAAKVRQPTDDAIVWAEQVSVRYRVPHEKVNTLKESAIRTLQGRLVYADFWALKQVNLDLQPGEVMGIIGRNGAGKSTLLKVIARVLKPTSGRVVTVGSIAPLLELGTGLHPELTGRENIFLISAMLGRSRKRTEELYAGIVEFAGLQEFIDAPMRTYSSGMVARLGFSVATCVRRNILLIDEVLSVGDIHFREKCFARFRDFRDQGASILLVSHNLQSIREMCNRALWLHNGEIRAYGSADKVVAEYSAN